MVAVEPAQRIKLPAHRSAPALDLTIITPIYNERESIPALIERTLAAARELGRSFELICVDDGSADDSLAALKAAAAVNPEVKIVAFRRNFGQTAALMAGIDHSRGEVIVCLDADLQNDPKDIVRLLEKLDQGYDVVSGWRRDRQDARIKRVFVSRLANRLISWASGVRLSDYGCTLKAYRREVLSGGARLYGEMHRFIPIYTTWQGAKVTEIPVDHHARVFGKSKYGMGRVVKVLLDLFVVLFLQRYLSKPIYFFGGFAVVGFALGAIAFVYMLWLKFAEGTSMISTPLPLLSAMGALAGTMSLLMGLLAEVLTRTYYESQDRPAYVVRETVNLSPSPGGTA